MPIYANSAAGVQPKLTINQPCDDYEKEADAVADKIVQMGDKPIAQPLSFMPVPEPVQRSQRKCAHCKEEEKKEDKPLQLQSVDSGTIQRKCAACEEEEEKQLQRKASGEHGGGTVSPIIEQALQSPGQAMNGQTRSFMEQRFGYTFGKFRIHDDDLAHRSSSAIRARAYTYQNHVVFGAGQYNPLNESGNHLLAHELAHVVQQSSGEATKITGSQWILDMPGDMQVNRVCRGPIGRRKVRFL